MANQNKIFTTLNQTLGVQFYSLANPDASPETFSTLEGVPLGTSTNAADGELGLKVIIIANRASGGGNAVTIADGADTAEGTTTDTPSTAVEDATARTGISLWKGIKNYLKTLASYTLGSGTRDSTTQRVTICTNDNVNISGSVNQSGAWILSSPNGTYVTVHVAASSSLSGGIPTTAKRWAVNFLGTGTANTFGTNTSVKGGQSFSDDGIPQAALAISCDANTTADVLYSTT